MFFLQTNGSGVLSFVTGGGKFESALFHVRDEKTSGTNGGTFTSGSFQTRTLNTSVTNEISGASLSSNQIILPSGTYFIIASAAAYQVDSHKVKLRNITDSSDVLIGTSERIASAITDSQTRSFVIGRFTISAQKTFELQHRCATTSSTFGFGCNAAYSVVEVYADVQIWKVA
jgi:hypothetical protein